MTPDALANWRGAVIRARDWRKARNIPYVFTIAPDKHVIYAEQMPDTLARVGDLSRADQLFTTLQDTGVAVDVRPSLFDARTRDRIYHQTDTHWNDRGALVAYQPIIGAVRARVPRTPIAWRREDFEPAEQIAPGMDLAGMMGLKRVLREENLRLVPRHPRRAHVVEPAGPEPTGGGRRLLPEIGGPPLPPA